MKALLTLLFTMLFAVALPTQAADKDAKDSKTAAKPTADAKKAPESKKAGESEKIDINTASDKELDKLPGIGEARAKAIIKGRPYKAKDDLVERKILSKSVYDKIKDRIIAKQGK
jgi:competence protein ComEA